MPSQRQLRVGELIRHALSDILQRGEILDPVLERHVITVPEVRMSPDLKHATAFVMPLGGREPDAVVKALRRNSKPLRSALVGRVELKFLPQLHFEIDTSFEAGAKIDAILASPDVRRDTAREKDEADDDGGDGE